MSKLGVLIISTIFLASCAHRHVKQVSLAPNAEPLVEIQALEKQLAEQRSNQIDVMAPDHFYQAEKYLKEAKEDYEDGDDRADILDSVAWSKAYANRAQTVGERVKDQVAPISRAREAAMTARADRLMPNTFKKVDKDLKSFTEDLEYDAGKGNLDSIKKLQARYLDLELQGIKREKLGQAQALIERAVSKRAAKFVPRTLLSAQAQYAQSEKIIETDRHNEEAVNVAAAEATKAAEDLNTVLAYARDTRGSSAEASAIKMFRQHENLKSAQVETKELEAAMAANQQVLGQQQQEISSLEQTATLDAALKAAQQTFGPNEAEVYRQGDRLLIRLKGINFAKNRDELSPSGLAALKKVKDVIGQLDAQKVIVEGHTDATGSVELNKRLSQARADTVKKYLVVDQVMASDNIETVGVGFQKPVTTNKTAAGRAQNRRVDLIIVPSTATASTKSM